MIRCQDVATELWAFLDGELPPGRAAAIAGHLEACARCYPQYRFQYGFLAAVARQRRAAPAPSALVDEVADAIRASTGRDPRRSTGPAEARAIDTRPRAQRPLPAPEPMRPAGHRGEQAALVALRASLGALLLMCAIRLVTPAAFAAVPPAVTSAVAALEGLMAGAVLAGLWRRWSYGAAILVHAAALLLLWHVLHDVWGLAAAAFPAAGLLLALYLLRERDRWTIDAWMTWRHARHATG